MEQLHPPELDQNRGDSVLRISLVTLSIAVILLILRMIARIWILRKVWWDDYSIVAASVSEDLSNILLGDN